MKKYIKPAIVITHLVNELLVGVHSDAIDPGSSLAPRRNFDDEQWIDEVDRNYGGIRSHRLHDDFE